MKEIFLTQGKIALVDDKDADLDQLKWCTFKCKSGNFYAIRNSPEIKGTKKLPNILMHRVIAERMGIEHPDHINRNGLDNRRCNLRESTPSQNSINRGPAKRNASGQKGVSRQRNKWLAQIMINGKCKFLGYFDDIKDAARTYNEAALKYFGEFAYLNKV